MWNSVYEHRTEQNNNFVQLGDGEFAQIKPLSLQIELYYI